MRINAFIRKKTENRGSVCTEMAIYLINGDTEAYINFRQAFLAKGLCQEKEEGRNSRPWTSQINFTGVLLADDMYYTLARTFLPLFAFFPFFFSSFILFFFPVRLQLTWVASCQLTLLSFSLFLSLSIFPSVASQFCIRDYQRSYFSTSCPGQSCFCFLVA